MLQWTDTCVQDRVDGRVMRHVDICDNCGRHIFWYEPFDERRLESASNNRKGRKRCFVCISQAMQARHHVKFYR